MTTQNKKPIPGTTRYYKNCRGFNYNPSLESQWRVSGYLPRIPVAVSVGGYANSATFLGSNKTTMWWYYNHEDNENCIRLLRSIGANAVRVFLDLYVWARNKELYWENVEDFLKICDKYKIRVQFVVFDGIYIQGVAAEPSSEVETVSAVEHGLISTWQKIPYSFQENLSTSAGLNFYNNSAIPFVSSLLQNVSSHQSFWSIDLANEHYSPSVSALVSGIGYTISSMLPDIPITFGHAAGMDAYTEPLTNGQGQGPGGVYSYSTSTPFRILSSVINFASIHPYQNNRIARRGFVEAASEASLYYNYPSMYNEGVITLLGARYHLDLSGFRDLDYGGLVFDGMIDRGLSLEPFLASQGLMYYDGTTRDKLGADAYSRAAVESGWLRPIQVNLNNTQKEVSVDNGVDGGFWSGVIPEHQEFLPDVYVSANRTAWEATKSLFYTTYPTILYRYINSSKNYPPYAGHPMDTQKPNYLELVSGPASDYSGLLYRLYNWREAFPIYLSSLPSSIEGSHARDRDIMISKMDNTIYNLFYLTLGDQFSYLRPELHLSQYDESVIPSSVQYILSAAYDPFIRATSSIIVTTTGVGPTILSSQIECMSTSSCLFNVSGNPNSGINWAAYDAAYDDLVVKLKNCFDYILSAATTDDRYRLYP